MVKKLYTESYVEDIADAIRAKNDSSDTYTVAEMAAAISSLPLRIPANMGLGSSLYASFPSNTIFEPREHCYSMFINCALLETAPFFDTSNVASMRQMFGSCQSLVSVPLYDTSNVTDMHAMFGACLALTAVPAFDTSKVTDMGSMFYNCRSLASVPLFDTSSVENMEAMFGWNYSITEVPLFDTSNVTNMDAMFYFCEGLISVPQFDTGKVEGVGDMFRACSALTTLPVFDFSSVGWDMVDAFSGCDSLTNESLQNILKTLLTATSYTGSKTLKQIGLSGTQATTCTGFTEWTTLSSNGWTTGY